jgi:hypothetical protein
MGQFSPDSVNNDALPSFINLVEGSISADTQFPHRFRLMPRRLQARQRFSLPCLSPGLVGKLPFYCIQYTSAFMGSQFAEIIGDVFRVFNLVHGME